MYCGQWKSRLAYDYIHVAEPLDHPTEKYAEVITQEEWTTFVKWRTSDDGMALRKRNIRNQKESQHPHLTGRVGYIGIEDAVVRVHSSFI